MNGSGNPLAEQVKNLEIFITGAGSKVITGLPVGTYTVTEDTGWSWRYEVEANEDRSATLAAGKSDETISFVNALTNTKWLSSEDVKVNTFTCVNTAQPNVGLADAIVPEKEEEI